MIRGRIEKALSGFYYVNTGAETLQCRARGKFRREGMSPLVGDWVQVRELGGGEGFVEAVEPRRNAFDRPVIIASAALPVTDPYLIDRISAIAALKDCRVLLCLNKCDLDPAEELYGIYSGSAIRVLRVSAVTGQGIDELRRELAGKLSAFTGNSGVGKSSILNALDPRFSLAVGEVSKALGRGRHTTRHVELFSLGQDTYVIDTHPAPNPTNEPAGDLPGVCPLCRRLPLCGVQPHQGEGLRRAGGRPSREDPSQPPRQLSAAV